MENTKNDLSYNEATLDFEALCSTTVFAFIKTRDELNKKLKGLYNLAYDKDNKSLIFDIPCWMEANNIKQLGEQLVIITDTAYTLYEARKRQNLNITNKKEVKIQE